MSYFALQIRLRTHRLGCHGPKSHTQHERSRVCRHCLQQDRREGGRVLAKGCQRHEHRWRSLAQGIGRLVEEASQSHDACQR